MMNFNAVIVPAIAVIVSLAAVYLIVSALAGVLMVKSFSFSRNSSVADTMSGGLERGEFTQAFLDHPWEEMVIESPYGYALKGVFWRGPEGADKTVILVHGHTSTWVGMGKYAEMFFRDGWNVAAYSHRRHGDSEGGATTGGYYEKHDLKAVADKVWELFPQTKVFGVYGESMGSATVLQYLPLDEERLTFAVTDCPYSRGKDLFVHQMNRVGIPGFIQPAALGFGRLWMRLLARFPLGEMNPLDEAVKTQTPLLLIHGEADNYVPTWMSRAIYEARKDTAPTEYHGMPEAKHAVSIQQNRSLYESWVTDFLGRYAKGD